MENKRVITEWMPRTEAEQEYGFGLYQGGVPPGDKIRIVKVGDDVEACAGTHCVSTGVIGPIKILKSERIQDGVERIEFAAGVAAVRAMQKIDSLLNNSAKTIVCPLNSFQQVLSASLENGKTSKKKTRNSRKNLPALWFTGCWARLLRLQASRSLPNSFLELILLELRRSPLSS